MLAELAQLSKPVKETLGKNMDMWFADALVGQADQAHGIVLAGLGSQIDAAQVDARWRDRAL
mgnify:CR=1 FL=1|jgi:hypothetical protein